METLHNGKAMIRHQFDGLEIIVPSWKHWWNLTAGSLWLIGWGAALFMVSNFLPLETILAGEADFSGWFLLAWLFGWIFGGVSVLRHVLWGFFGEESVLIQGPEFIFRKEVFGFGSRKVFDKNAIRDIRFDPGQQVRRNWRSRRMFNGLDDGKIKFAYGMKTFHFGFGLDDAEAKHIVHLLKEKLPQHQG